jgi:M6 family metalloprotease-like protein
LIIESKHIARNPTQRNATEKAFLQSISTTEQVEKITQTKQASKMRQAPSAEVMSKYPKTGSPKSLVILVNFSDKSFVTPTPQTAFTNLLNQDGYSANGGTGSARDYFRSASYGKFAPAFDVVGPYTLPNNMAYYGGNDSNGDDLRPLQMVIDACNLANNAGLDFTQYDTDGDGKVDNVFIYYAGFNEAEDRYETMPNTVWPHRWGIYPKTLFQYYNYEGTVASVTFDGKRVEDYACTSELKGYSGSNMCGIGTFAHEFGHVLGLPDYYHTNTTVYKATLEDWSLMDSGGYLNEGRTPPTYSVYDRFYLGWLSPQQVNTASDLTLLPIYQGKTQPANTNQQAYLLSATTHDLNGALPNPVEFFMLEYRKKVDWDFYLPGEGMLIWHIDFNQTAWDYNTVNNYTGTSQTASSHMRVYLQPLSGSTSTPGAAFTSGSFTPTTWAGVNINRPITNITKTDANITFKLMGGTPFDPNSPVVVVGKIDNALEFPATKLNVTRAKTLNIKTTDLTGNLSVAISGTNASYFTVSVSSITKDAANGTSGSNITINYNPTVAGSHSATLTISGGGLNPAKVISLVGSGY